jgi:hypothetical protein
MLQIATSPLAWLPTSSRACVRILSLKKCTYGACQQTCRPGDSRLWLSSLAADWLPAISAAHVVTRWTSQRLGVERLPATTAPRSNHSSQLPIAWRTTGSPWT